VAESIFELRPCLVATREGSETARLCFKDDVLLAILVPAGSAAHPRWFLQAGFGPCAGEGLIFDTLEEARAWLEESTSVGVPKPATPNE
jgi:hypothetical protein